MTQEEKARAYDKVSKEVKNFFEGKQKMYSDVIQTLEYLFPELKESEDERMWKLIKKYAHSNISDMALNADHITRKQLESWLEKQGEKPQGKSALEAINEEVVDNANKVGPKFKVGDFIADYYCRGKIVKITDDSYLLDTGQGIPFSCEHNTHLWTIADAKDGDVLAGSYGTFIFMGESDGYCGVLSDNTFIRNTGNNEWTEDLHPATKEQRDLLFKKMRESGYEWDSEKKELRKIEQKSLQWNISDYKTWQYIVSDVLTKHDGIGQYLDDGFCKNIAKYMQENWSKKLSLGQKSAWSEEDETCLDHIITAVEIYYTDDKGKDNPWRDELLRWIESLKQRLGGEK